MRTFIKLEKDDIVTRPLGNNLVIDMPTLAIIFSPGAAQEFARDVQTILVTDNGIATTSDEVESQECLAPELAH